MHLKCHYLTLTETGSTPIEPVRFQFEANAGAQHDFFGDWETPYQALVTGLGGGKTFGAAAKLVAMHCWWPGTDSLAAEPTHLLIKQVMVPALCHRLAAWGIAYEVNWSRMDIVTPEFGSRIYLHSTFCAERITGFTVGRTWYDEAGRMRASMEDDKDPWKAAINRTRDFRVPERQRQIMCSGTHEGEGTWFYDRFENSDSPLYRVYRGSTYENPGAKEYADTLVREHGKELARQYVFGGAVGNDLAVVTWAMLERAGELPSRIDPEWERLASSSDPLYAGVDVGRTKGLTVIWLIRRTAARQLLTEGIIALKNTDFAEQDRIIERVLSLRPLNRLCIDRGFNPQTYERAVRRHGEHRVEGCSLGASMQKELVEGLQRPLQAGNISIPDDEDVAGDLMSVKRVQADNGTVTYKAPVTRNGHADRFWALALALRAAGTGRQGPIRCYSPRTGRFAELTRR